MMKENIQSWELAWAAAFIEGEGTLTINASPPCAKCGSLSPRFTVWVKADNTEPEPIYRLQNLFGGAVRRYQHKKGYKPAYRWLVASQYAVICVNAIKPYFASKRRLALADLLLSLNERITKTNHTGKLSNYWITRLKRALTN